MKRFVPFAAVVAALSLTAASAVSAQEIASHPLAVSTVGGIATDNANAIDDPAFTAQIRAQLQSVLAAASKELPWKAQIVAPETLGWEKGGRAAAPLVAAFDKRLKDAGYKVTGSDLGEHDGSTIRLLTATRAGQVLIGAWFLGDTTTILGWGFAAPVVGGSGTTLASGTPPLTEGIVGGYTDYLIWLFGRPELGKAREQVRQVAAAYLGDQWKNSRAGAMAGTLTVLHGMTKRGALSKPEQEGARQWLLHRLRVAAYGSKPDDRAAESILAVYERVDPTVARAKPGAPPLTRSVRDAYVALQSFMLTQMPGGVTLDAGEKKALGDWLVAAFPTWSADEQRKIAQSAVTWQMLQQEWAGLTPAKKAEAKNAWKAQLGPLAASVREQRDSVKVAAAKPAALGKSRTSYANALEKAQSSYRTYQTLSSAMTQMHYTRMNAMASWGGSPYRYVNQWGSPY